MTPPVTPAETLANKCLRLASLCEAALEAFQEDTAPYRWLTETAQSYRDAERLLSRQSHSNDLILKFSVKR